MHHQNWLRACAVLESTELGEAEKDDFEGVVLDGMVHAGSVIQELQRVLRSTQPTHDLALQAAEPQVVEDDDVAAMLDRDTLTVRGDLLLRELNGAIPFVKLRRKVVASSEAAVDGAEGHEEAAVDELAVFTRVLEKTTDPVLTYLLIICTQRVMGVYSERMKSSRVRHTAAWLSVKRVEAGERTE
jgi:hypothetical protein